MQIGCRIGLGQIKCLVKPIPKHLSLNDVGYSQDAALKSLNENVTIRGLMFIDLDLGILGVAYDIQRQNDPVW